MPESEYHTKNRARHADRALWDEKLEGKMHAVSPTQSYKDPYGWLVNMVNRFAHGKGKFRNSVHKYKSLSLSYILSFLFAFVLEILDREMGIELFSNLCPFPTYSKLSVSN